MTAAPEEVWGLDALFPLAFGAGRAHTVLEVQASRKTRRGGVLVPSHPRAVSDKEMKVESISY